MEQRCIIIGASPEADVHFLRRQVDPQDYVICADGGWRLAERAGIRPRLIVGDFDSSPRPSAFTGEVISLPAAKDDTDTLYAVKEGIRRGFRQFLLLGMIGGRADHTFANYSALLYLAQRGMHGSMADSSGLCTVLCGGSITLTEQKGKGFGIFPFGCTGCTITLKGFLYEVDKYFFTADFPLGVSNTVTQESAEVTVHEGSALLFVYE